MYMVRLLDRMVGMCTDGRADRHRQTDRQPAIQRDY